jgi:hypothetical protein
MKTTPHKTADIFLYCHKNDQGNYDLYQEVDAVTSMVTMPADIISVCGPFLRGDKLLFCGLTTTYNIYIADFLNGTVSNLVELILNSVCPFIFFGRLFYVHTPLGYKHKPDLYQVMTCAWKNGQQEGKPTQVTFDYQGQKNNVIWPTRMAVYILNGVNAAFLSGQGIMGRKCTDLFILNASLTAGTFVKCVTDSNGNDVYKPAIFEGMMYYVNSSDESDIFVEELVIQAWITEIAAPAV